MWLEFSVYLLLGLALAALVLFLLGRRNSTASSSIFHSKERPDTHLLDVIYLPKNIRSRLGMSASSKINSTSSRRAAGDESAGEELSGSNGARGKSSARSLA